MTELEESFKRHTTLKNTVCPASTLEGSRRAITGSVRALVTGRTLQACEDRDTCSQMIIQTNTFISPTKKIWSQLPGRPSLAARAKLNRQTQMLPHELHRLDSWQNLWEESPFGEFTDG